MKNGKRFSLALLVCFLLPAAKQLNAQGMLSSYNSYYGMLGKHSRHNYNSLHWYSSLNECLKYYYNPDDTTQPVFKAVTITTYACKDSTLSHKIFGSKQTMKFDKTGQLLYSETSDSTGVRDSIRAFYDMHGNELRSYEYSRYDSNRITKTSDEIWVYNANGMIVLDSSYNSYGNKYADLDGPGNKYERVMKYKYNADGDNYEMTMISGDDTSSSYSKFVMHRRVYNKFTSKATKGETYMSYNMVGNLTGYKAVTINYNDTSVITTGYNDTGRMVKYVKTDNGKLENVDSVIFNDDGTSTEVEDRITNSYSPTVCPNDSRTVTISDKNGNILSEVKTELKSGKPFTKSIKHSYTFDGKGRIVLDSCKTVEQGYLYASSSTNIERFVFDAHGNKIEEDGEGGGQYAKNGSETWKYNEHNKLLTHNTYNSCNADIPETSTMNIYYPGGLKIIECIENKGKYNGKDYTYYTEDSRLQEEVKSYYGSYQLILYEYKK
jgi:hypothetical protein